MGWRWTAFALALVASSCTSGRRFVPANAQGAPPPQVVVAPSPAISSMTEPKASAAPKPEPPLTAKNSFACGKHRCRAGAESCCSAGDVSVCAPDAPRRPSDATQPLGSQISLCKAAPYRLQVDEIVRCRSSAHCASGDRCCSQWLFSGGGALVCVPATTTCDFGEACTADLPCRTPNTVCVKGTCRQNARIECGGARCDLESHTCLVLDPNSSKPECVADTDPRIAKWHNEGRPILKVSCVSPSDCLPGERCRYAMGATTCQHAEYGMSAVICDHVSDCPKDLCRGAPPGHKKLVCFRHPDDWHAVCDCR